MRPVRQVNAIERRFAELRLSRLGGDYSPPPSAPKGPGVPGRYRLVAGMSRTFVHTLVARTSDQTLTRVSDHGAVCGHATKRWFAAPCAGKAAVIVGFAEPGGYPALWWRAAGRWPGHGRRRAGAWRALDHWSRRAADLMRICPAIRQVMMHIRTLRRWHGHKCWCGRDAMKRRREARGARGRNLEL